MATGAPDFHRNVNLYGFDGSVLRLVRVDSDQGRMQAMLNAMYNSTPTPLKCDSNGQIQINLSAQGLDRLLTLPQVPSGAQIVSVSGAAVNELVILHTVPANVTFYLVNAILSVTWYATEMLAYLAVRDSGGNVIYIIAGIVTYVFGAINIPVSFPFSLPIPSGYDLVVLTNSSDVTAFAYVSGWEE